MSFRKEVREQLEEVFAELADDAAVPIITRDELRWYALSVGLTYVEEIKECIEEVKGKPCTVCGKATHEVCDGNGEPLCDDDDCAITSKNSEFLARGERYCHDCFHELGY